MIKCCIFDLDGTILDTIVSITYFVNKTLNEYGIESVSVDECKYFAGNGARNLIKRALTSKGVTDEALTEKILTDYVEAYDNDPLYLTTVFEGIDGLLSELRLRGVKLAVLSNKPDSTVKSIVKDFFGDAFDVALGGREGVPLKPDPTAALDILNMLGFTPEETAWVGDTSTDIETAKNLKAALSVGVLWGFRKRDELEGAGADIIASSADEVLRGIMSLD